MTDLTFLIFKADRLNFFFFDDHELNPNYFQISHYTMDPVIGPTEAMTDPLTKWNKVPLT